MDAKEKEMFENLKSTNIDDSEVKSAESKAGFLKGVGSDFLLMISMLKDYWNGDFEISKMELMVIIGAVSYVALPLDVVPDFIPIAGYLDDASVVTFALSQIRGLVNRYKRER